MTDPVFHAKHRFHSLMKSQSNSTNFNLNSHHSTNVVQSIQSSLIFLLNSLLLILIIKRPKLRRKKSHQFIVNLLLINIALSISCMISYYYYWVFDYIIINGLLLTMFLNLMLTTADRFMAMKYPSRYLQLTGKKVIFILFCSWIPATFFVPVVRFIGIKPEGLKVMHVSIILLSSIVLASSNFMVYCIARNHETFVKKHSNHSRKSTERKKKFLKASYICFAVVISFILFWMPYCIHDILELLEINIKVNHYLHTVVEQLALLNSLTDPIIFTFLSISTHKEIKVLWKQVKCIRKKESSTLIVDEL